MSEEEKPQTPEQTAKAAAVAAMTAAVDAKTAFTKKLILLMQQAMIKPVPTLDALGVPALGLAAADVAECCIREAAAMLAAKASSEKASPADGTTLAFLLLASSTRGILQVFPAQKPKEKEKQPKPS